MLTMALHNTKGLLLVPMAWRSRILNYIRQIKWLLRNFPILPFRDLHRVWWNGCLVGWLESQCVIAAHPTEIISRWSVEEVYIISKRFESSWQKSLPVAIKHPFVKIDGGSEACAKILQAHGGTKLQILDFQPIPLGGQFSNWAGNPLHPGCIEPYCHNYCKKCWTPTCCL